MVLDGSLNPIRVDEITQSIERGEKRAQDFIWGRCITYESAAAVEPVSQKQGKKLPEAEVAQP